MVKFSSDKDNTYHIVVATMKEQVNKIGNTQHMTSDMRSQIDKMQQTLEGTKADLSFSQTAIDPLTP